ncbi:hypothetical protein L198_06440 [Cryptococcus wingfieldii CBS 7118]|uniref:F-box domain-containing protein n=1 Tax=Cryptococcus wingfieldii CBS 7118 TaxID=1295528 RepID=A0A1E3IP90_9TREE|nr:hypothetical protein L198_06440 [Cryptococcus wingfieldii CBS 7118]ODN89746.1 hypothetical protein L198_06440 [Cryptococcus wingfieldii CBS 7118]
MAIDTLDTLPSEVRNLIFEYLQATTHKPTLSSLMRVSRGMYAKSMPLLYERVRLNASNAEAYFGRLTANGLGAIDEEIASHKPHLSHYIWQLATVDCEPPLPSFVPSPIARKICQIWSTKDVFLEDAPTVAYLQQAATSVLHLYRQLEQNLDGQVEDMKYVSEYVLDDLESLVLGEPLARSLIHYPKVWESVANTIREDIDTRSLCLRIPADCASASAAQYCRDMLSTNLDPENICVLCIHNANPLDYMFKLNVYESLHFFLRPEDSPGMLSHEASIGAFMSSLLASIKESQSTLLLPDQIHFYNSQFTAVDRVSHQSWSFWDELEREKKDRAATPGRDLHWPVTLKLFGTDEKVACPVCGETV